MDRDFQLNKRGVRSRLFPMQSVFTGPAYAVKDNIDTDQIIPAQYLTLVPTIPEEYEKLGSYAMCGLPESLYPTRFVKEGQLDSEYSIVVLAEILAAAVRVNMPRLRSVPPGAKSFWPRVSPEFFSAIQLQLENFIPARSPSGSSIR